jgi:very-short-patch-repair endonuclease
VIVPGRDPGRKPGIRIHRVKSLDARETRTRFNIPVTSPARTLLDLAATHPAHVEQALGEAYAKRLATAKELLSLLDRHPRHRGTRALRALVEADRAPARLRSEAEARLLALIRKAGLPEPEVNVREGPYVLDFLWRAHRLVVEVDGFAFHSSRAAFERDRCRDADLVARGLRVIRVTWRQIIDEPEAILVRLAQALARV